MRNMELGVDFFEKQDAAPLLDDFPVIWRAQEVHWEYNIFVHRLVSI